MAAPDRKLLLQRSWTEVARGYQTLFVPRFMPWTVETLDAFLEAQPPEGLVAVPCCGPGQELEMLASRLAEGHRILGVDLADGMVELARQRIERLGLGGRVQAQVGDAAALSPGLQDLAGVVSVFGLQQIPQPHAVLANWVRALRPGGVLAVCYWGKEVEDEGPWRRLMDLTTATRPQDEWEADIPGAAVREGAEVVLDCKPQHTMSWPSVDDFWEGMVRSGPWHSRLLHYGEEHMEQLRQQFMAAYPNPAKPLVHRPHARLLVLRRLVAAL